MNSASKSFSSTNLEFEAWFESCRCLKSSFIACSFMDLLLVLRFHYCDFEDDLVSWSWHIVWSRSIQIVNKSFFHPLRFTFNFFVFLFPWNSTTPSCLQSNFNHWKLSLWAHWTRRQDKKVMIEPLKKKWPNDRRIHFISG